MKLILRLTKFSYCCGSLDHYYSFEEDDKKKAEDDLFELAETRKKELDEYNLKSRTFLESLPPTHQMLKNKRLMDETLEKRKKFNEENIFPGYQIQYKGHFLDISLFYEDDQFLNPEIFTLDEFYQSNLP